MELLNSCRDYAHKYYCDLLIAAEKTLSDSLFEQSEKSNSDQEQRLYFEAMQQLRTHSDLMHDCYRQEQQHLYQTFAAGLDQSDQNGDDLTINDLTLVNREELEDELAISVIISKANSRNSEELWKLNRRLAALRGGKPVDDEHNPFGPAAVCHALQIAVHQLELDNRARLLIYKHLGKILIVSFNKVLKGLNERLVDKGILPNLRFSAAEAGTESADAVQTAPVELPLGDEGGSNAAHLETNTAVESQSSITHQQQIYNAIRTLQANTGPRTHTAGGVSFEGLSTDGAAGRADTFAPIDYALALSAVQQSQEFIAAVNSNQPLSAEQVEARVLQQLQKQSNPEAHHKMASDDANTVDLVGMIFRYILDDENLSDTVKSLLSHLHTPYLKLSLMDNTFLENYQHSARVLINSMAEVGGRWVMDDDDRTVLPKLKNIVETVLKGFVDDVTIFDRLLEDFQRFRENLEKRAQMVEKRNTESQQGMERLEISKQRALEEIETRLEQSGIPEVSQNIIRKPWADFLAFNLLRHGEESLTWESALKVVDGAVWSVEQGKTIDSKEDFRRRQAEFDQTVQEGLEAIGYDAQASGVLLGCLKEAQELAYHEVVMGDAPQTSEKLVDSHEQAKPVTTPEVAPKGEPRKVQPKARKSLHKEKPVLTAREQEVADTLQDIAFGTWFDFEREDGTSDRLKLAWYSRVTSHYMFVNRSGVKQAVETHANLAKGIAAGAIAIVKPEKRSFMERALDVVLGRLKRKAA